MAKASAVWNDFDPKLRGLYKSGTDSIFDARDFGIGLTLHRDADNSSPRIAFAVAITCGLSPPFQYSIVHWLVQFSK